MVLSNVQGLVVHSLNFHRDLNWYGFKEFMAIVGAEFRVPT
jgi:hypothetical protein